MLFWSLLMLASFPAYLCAQETQLPTIEIKVSQDKVPLEVKQALLKDFGEGHQPLAFVTANSLFDTYAWEQTTNTENLEVYNYSLSTRTSSGSSLDANYTPDGKLISSREIVKNFKPDQSILMALQNSEYKDWVINNDFLLRKVLPNGSEKGRYSLVMSKGNEKKTIYFDVNGRMENKRGELADAN